MLEKEETGQEEAGKKGCRTGECRTGECRTVVMQDWRMKGSMQERRDARLEG